jgi:hypothetical protein
MHTHEKQARNTSCIIKQTKQNNRPDKQGWTKSTNIQFYEMLLKYFINIDIKLILNLKKIKEWLTACNAYLPLYNTPEFLLKEFKLIFLPAS